MSTTTETRLQAIERRRKDRMWYPRQYVDADIDYLLSLLKECKGVIEQAIRLHDKWHLNGMNCVCEMNESARQTLAKLE